MNGLAKRVAMGMSFMFCLAFLGMSAESGVDAGAPFGVLPLVQEIDCSAENGDLLFVEFPKGASKVEEILGRKCRVLGKDGECKYFAYRVGEGKGLKAGAGYILSVEFPDDVPRSVFICNWGFETAAGFHTGTTVGDALMGRYTNSNPESLQVPQSGKFLQWRQYFHLYDRFPEIKRSRGQQVRPLLPENGFWVVVAQLQDWNDPTSAGAAVSKIRLFEVPEPEKLHVKINYPPEGLPRRHLFFREEMADGVIGYGHKPEEQVPELRGIDDRVKFYEYKVWQMKMLGLNTFCKDLLEFGHNQGWDSAKYGGSAWYNQSSDPAFWDRIVEMLSKHGDLTVMPYYEYAGSIGQDKKLAIGSQRRCDTLQGGKDYTHIEWVHKTNADLTDPDFIEDASRVLEVTMAKHKDKVKFLGAWFRPRPEANPISFNQKAIDMFSKEANGGARISRSSLDADKDLLEKYYSWWFGKRRDFNVAMRDYLRKNVAPDAVFFYTCDSSEGGYSLSSEQTGKGQKEHWKWKRVVLTDQFEKWQDIINGLDAKKFGMFKAFPYDKAVAEDLYLDVLLKGHGTWGKFEWQHACPKNDPGNYKGIEGVMLTYTFNKLFTVASEKAMDEFRTKGGLAMARHYFLNENEMVVNKDDILGYFVADMERAGAYSMLAEARALANGDPRYIAYLFGNSFSRGFPEYVRDFNAAFLSLPALPSSKLSGASKDPELVVRSIPAGEHGHYFAVINTGMAQKSGVEVVIPAKGAAVNAATGAGIELKDGKLILGNLYPGQVVSVKVK